MLDIWSLLHSSTYNGQCLREIHSNFLSFGPPVALEQNFIHNTADSGPGIRKKVVMSPTAGPKGKSNPRCTGITQTHTKYVTRASNHGFTLLWLL